MKFSLSVLMRPAVICAIFLNIVAIGVAKRDGPLVPLAWKWASEPHVVGVNGYLMALGDRTSRLLDAEAGSLRNFEIESGDVVDNISGSRWQDASGQRQA